MNKEKLKRYHIDNSRNCYVQEDTTAFNEAVITFTGEVKYSKDLPGNCLEFMNAILDDSDFSVVPASLGKSLLRDSHKDEFVGALGYAGFDACLFGEKSSAKYCDGVSISITPDVAKIVDVNGIRIGVVNAAVKTSRDVGSKLASQVAGLRAKTEFILVYCRCAEQPAESDVKALAEQGADYIVFNCSDMLKSYGRVGRSDGKIVPFIYSVGTALELGKVCNTAIFRLKILRDYNGEITLEDEFVPCIFDANLPGRENCMMPTRGFYNGRYVNDITKAAAKNVRKTLGKGIKMSSKIRPFTNMTGFSPQVSIKEICDILGVDSDFYDGDFPIDEKVHSIVIRNVELSEKCIAVLDETDEEDKQNLIIKEDMLKEIKPIMAIAQKKVEGVPTLIVDSPSEAFIEISRYIRKKYDLFTVAITGSVGKSTVTDMIKTVMAYNYKFPNIKGNYNTFRSVGFCLQKLTDKHDAYIQELHGGHPGAASLGSSIVLPNIAVVTSIAEVHLERLGNSIEGVKREKLGIADYIQEGGALVVNNDNEYLQNLDMPMRLVTYGAFNKNSDFYADNINEMEDKITFTIVCEKGSFDAEIFCRGLHNVCNAVGAFAVCRLAGIQPHVITSALSRYRTSGFRQNLIKKDGYKIFADCFNSAPESVKSSLHSLAGIHPTHGGRRIAVLGDMNELAELSEIRHRETGKMVAESDADVLITLGEKAKFIAEEAMKEGQETYAFVDREEMENKIREIVKPGDVILFKASHSVRLDISIENIFGKMS